jgi:Flp pilus assembly protein CpaB
MVKTPSGSLVKILISITLAIFFVHFYVQNQINQKMREFESVDVLAAARDIPAMTILKEGDFKAIHVAQKFVQPETFIDKIPGQNAAYLVGKKTLITLPADTQISRFMVAEIAIQDLEKTIPLGKRAYALYLPRTETLRLIHAGSHVDVVANLTSAAASGTEQVQAKTVLQDILVLNVRDEMFNQNQAKPVGTPSNDSYTLLTLAVTPHEAELLAVTEKVSQGDFRILIRSPYDSSVFPHPKSAS